MFVYIGLVAAIVLAGPPANSGATETGIDRGPAVIGDSPLLRHDI